MSVQPAANPPLKNDISHLSRPLQFFVAAMNGLDRIAPAITDRLMLAKFVQPRRKKNADYRTRLPEGARRLAVRHGEQTLTGWAWGDRGPALLVIHGWESDTSRMLPLIKPLLDEGYRVFALDAPGHGLSPRANTHLQDVSAAVEGMVEQHGPFLGIIAHSFGAAATTLLLARRPELMPEKLVLLSPMRDLAQHLDIFAAIAQLSPDRKERLTQLLERRYGIIPAECCAVTAAARLPRPGLVIHDRDDRLIPHDTGAAIASNWRGARLISTSRLGHRRGLGSAQVVARVLDYLTAVNSAPATAAQLHTTRRRPAPALSRPRFTLGELRRMTAT